MTVIKSLWAAVQGNPKVMRKINGWLTIAWIVMIPVSIVLGLLSSVVYVSALSLWALVSGHWSAWQAARVEVQQMAEMEERERNPIEERIVDRLVADTDVNSTKDTTDSDPHPALHIQVAHLMDQVAALQQSLASATSTSAGSVATRPDRS